MGNATILSSTSTGTGTPIIAAAPNMPSATITAIYGLVDTASAFGFAGTIDMPLTFDHLAYLHVSVRLLDGNVVAVVPSIPAPAPGTTSIDFTSDIKYIQDTTSDQNFSISISSEDENGLITAGPLTVVVLVQQAEITAITSPREVLVSGLPVLSVDPVNRLVSTEIGGIPVFNGGQVPQHVTYWISDNAGTSWIWIGSKRIDVVGTEIIFWRLKPGTSSSWKLAMVVNSRPGDPNRRISTAQLPPGTFVSSAFTVAGLGLASATLGVAPAIAPPDTTHPDYSASWPYNKFDSDGGQYWEIPSIDIALDTAYLDQNVFVLNVTMQDLDASLNPIGPEHIFHGVVPEDGVISLGVLMGAYGSDGFSYWRSYPYPGGTLANIAYVRAKFYASNRIDQTTAAWSNPAASILQTDVGSGAGYIDTLVAAGGALPPGKLNMGRADPDTLGGGLNNSNPDGVLELGTNDLSNAILNPRWDSGTAHWELINGAVLDATASETGGNALKLGTSNAVAVTAYPRDLIGCAPGQEWYFSVRAKNDASTTGHLYATLRFHANPDAGGEADVALSNIMPGTAGVWADYGAVLTVPATIGGSGHIPSFMEIVLANDSVTTGAFYVDRTRLIPQAAAGSGTEAHQGGLKIKYGAGTEDDGSGALQVKVGNGLALSGSQLVQKLLSLGGLSFDGSGHTQVDLGYTMQLNGSGEIVLANLPAVFGLPSLPSATYPQGSVILNTSDSKVYRNTTGSAWAKSSDPADLVAGAVASGVTINAAAITAGTMIVGVVYAGQITASQVNAGTFNGMSMSLVSNGLTTTLNNAYNSTVGAYYGFATVNNSTGYGGYLFPDLMAFQDANGVTGFGGGSVRLQGSTSVIIIEPSVASGGATADLVYFQNLPSSSPGGGSKRLWYDAAAGNVVKYAP